MKAMMAYLYLNIDLLDVGEEISVKGSERIMKHVNDVQQQRHQETQTLPKLPIQQHYLQRLEMRYYPPHCFADLQPDDNVLRHLHKLVEPQLPGLIPDQSVEFFSN